MKTLKYSIFWAIVFHLAFWIIGIINLNPEDYSSTRLGAGTNEQALINLLPSIMGGLIPIQSRLFKWITRYIEDE